MDRSTGRNPVEGVSTGGVAALDLILGQMPTINFFPADVVRHRTARWRGVRAKTMQIINHAPVEYRFKQQYHLLIAVEQGVCYEAETFIEGLPISTVRHCSHRLMFVPAGRMFSGAQRPRLLTRAICLYIDPHTVPVDPDLRFAEAELQPRLLFEDAGLWETVRKLKAQIGSGDPAARLHGRRSVASCPSSCCVSCATGLRHPSRRHVAGLPRGNRSASWISSRSTFPRTFRSTCSPIWCG